MSFELRRQTRWFSFLSPIVISTIILIQVSCTVAAPPKTATWKNSTGAEGFQRLLWQAVQDKDWLQVESHMASNFVYLGAGGSKDKPQTIEYLRSLNLKNFSLGDVTVTDSGVDAVVIYTVTTTTDSGQTNAPARHMAVWQQQKSGWGLIALSEVMGGQR